MAHDGMRDVVLADDPPLRAVPAAPHRGPGRRWMVMVAVLALLATVAVVQGARDRERAARLAATPGLLAVTTSAPQPSWSIPGGSGHLLAARADLLVAGFLEDGEQRLVANDAATGERRWQTSLAQVPIGQSLACHLLGPGDRGTSTHVVCTLAAPRPADVGYPGHGPGSEQRLVVLDAATGQVLRDRSLGLGFVAMTVDAGDVVLADMAQDGRVRAVRQDPVTGEVRWTFVSDDPLPGVGDGVGPPAPEVRVEHDVVVLEGPVSWALSADGDVLVRWRSGGPAAPGTGGPLEVTTLPDGRFAVGDPGFAREDGARYGAVATAAGSDRFPIDGPVLPLVVDDGSAADVLLTVPPGTGLVVALDRRTGDRLWEVARSGGGDAMVLDGRLLVTSRNRVVAVDARTGRELWTALHDRVVPDQQLLTDGRVVMVPTQDGGSASITALVPADGRVRWTAPGPPAVREYLVVDGGLFALTDERLVRMG
jgi:outer membrane protein assembly factor BamB